MKTLVAATAALFGVVVAVVFLWPGAPGGPEPLRYGIDACAECRMPVTRPGFGGELRDAEGRLTTYDDVGCLVRGLSKRPGGEAWVEDHGGTGFVPLARAHLVRARAETPMGSGLVAFRDEAAAERFAAESGGTIVALEDVVEDSNRLARGAEGSP